MTQNSEQPYQRATVIGGGVIGASWTALFLARGLSVTVCDPAPGIAQRIRTELAAIAPNLEQLGLPDVSSSSMPLQFDPEITTAVTGSDVVQENGPERLDVKQQLWRTVESGAPAHAILASSSSSIPASAMASGMKDPGRLIIGHPFNPPHLVPLVEIVASPSTPADIVDRAVGFYRAMGKRPQVLAKEIPGFVANRLQAALFREAVYLVAQGVVSEQQLDDVVTSSIGMRWAVGGPFRSFHLGGGPGGLADFIRHLGPALDALWKELGIATFDEATVATLTAQAANFGASVEELAARRDDAELPAAPGARRGAGGSMSGAMRRVTLPEDERHGPPAVVAMAASTAAARGGGSKAADKREEIFGSFDGMTSTLGVIAGLLATGASASKILAAAIGIAVAATIGMGAGQYLSDGQRNLRLAIVMGLATLVGSVLPAIPFIFGVSSACILASIAITLAAAGVIGHYRGYLVTYSILAVVSVLTVALSVMVA